MTSWRPNRPETQSFAVWLAWKEKLIQSTFDGLDWLAWNCRGAWRNMMTEQSLCWSMPRLAFPQDPCLLSRTCPLDHLMVLKPSASVILFKTLGFVICISPGVSVKELLVISPPSTTNPQQQRPWSSLILALETLGLRLWYCPGYSIIPKWMFS